MAKYEIKDGVGIIPIPKVTEIVPYAFDGCTDLKSIIIPDSVTEIGDYAVEGCTGLTSITFLDSVNEIGDDAFKDCTNLKAINVPSGKTDYFKNLLPKSLHDKIVELPPVKKAKK